ncbi:hypothetical protein FJT64_027436 [Amphibalanus amphitrite]|uniref:HTH psq-type domain-containing protein n=1 Tax=Amphibalanus amphitrite TaxID=1232801 RepID=A0A6A4WD27_AMPAM|nr:uncharacterized protein LOC122374906 [Amphibalanus amphitrite]XP_043236421.1 uncharacterized protein LOC122388944 [Amphibalanus amphitrite]KAF0299958.1 hypothetical protein FJT64_027436 [Amphibalanus amphitrite]
MEVPPGPVRRRHARWATESMRQALRDVHTGQRNMTAAARHHGIPRQTLVDYYKESCETGEHATILKRRGGRQAPEAGECAAADTPTSAPAGAAAAATSVSSAAVPAVPATPRDDFHRTLERTMAHLKVGAASLFTVSEVGLRACGHEPDADKAEPLHVLACVAASGRCLTPLVVFKEDAVPDELDGESSLGFHIATSKAGTVTEAIFARWMAEFVVQKPAGPALLLVNDDRYLSDQAGPALRLAADSDVAVLLLPERDAAALQPLDRVLLPSLAGRYEEESRSWHGQASGQCPLRACFRHIFSTAWHQTMASPLLVMAAFQVTGISPLAEGGERPAGGQALRAGVMAQLLRAVGHQWPPRLPPSLPVWFPRPLR